MGQEMECQVRFGGKVSAGKALIETDELIFRGGFRLKIALKKHRIARGSRQRVACHVARGDGGFHVGRAGREVGR